MQINKSCQELQSGDRYNYSVSIQDSLQDCDWTWQAEDGTVLQEGSFVVLDYCRRDIRHVVRCFTPSTLKEYIFNVFNETSPIERVNPTTPEPCHWRVWIIIAIVILLVLFIGGLVAMVLHYYRNTRSDPGHVVAGDCLTIDIEDEQSHPLNGNVHPVFEG